MNAREFFERAAELERAHTPFVFATVVKRYAPVSSHLGDRAIVFADGTMDGFVGGSCSRDIVREAALEALREGDARLVHVEGECASEGAVDVYVEPHLPARILIVVGNTPVAAEVARLGAMLDGFRVVRVVEEASQSFETRAAHAPQDDTGGAPQPFETRAAHAPQGDTMGASQPFETRAAHAPQDDTVGAPQPFETRAAHAPQDDRVSVHALAEFLDAMSAEERGRFVAVVASQGYYDESALEAILQRADPPYVGLLASTRRAGEVFADVQERGIAHERLARVHNPAGIDIGARRPGEVAISILAEIVATLAAQNGAAAPVVGRKAVSTE